MSTHLGAVCDEFYVSSRLFLKLDLQPDRETILHFFDRIRKDYPNMTKMRRRDSGGVTLDENNAEGAPRHWIRIESESLRFGQYSPPDPDEIRRYNHLITTHAPPFLTFSDLDYDHLELAYGFDLEYRGNHDQLVAETIFGEQFCSSFLWGDHARHVIDAQPFLGVALTDECDIQAYLDVKSRTSTYEVRSGTYESQPISVFLTLRKYWGVEKSGTLESVLSHMCDLADELAAEQIVPHFVNPLAAAIASRS